jgi:hypothetical protein
VVRRAFPVKGEKIGRRLKVVPITNAEIVAAGAEADVFSSAISRAPATTGKTIIYYYSGLKPHPDDILSSPEPAEINDESPLLTRRAPTVPAQYANYSPAITPQAPLPRRKAKSRRIPAFAVVVTGGAALWLTMAYTLVGSMTLHPAAGSQDGIQAAERASALSTNVALTECGNHTARLISLIQSLDSATAVDSIKTGELTSRRILALSAAEQAAQHARNQLRKQGILVDAALSHLSTAMETLSDKTCDDGAFVDAAYLQSQSQTSLESVVRSIQPEATAQGFAQLKLSLAKSLLDGEGSQSKLIDQIIRECETVQMKLNEARSVANSQRADII